MDSVLSFNDKKSRVLERNKNHHLGCLDAERSSDLATVLLVNLVAYFIGILSINFKELSVLIVTKCFVG